MTTSTVPQWSSTRAAAAPSDAASIRSAATTNASRPSASMSAAVSASEPGSGVVSDRATVDECSRASPGATVRAVIATSKPPFARYCAHALPMPRLAPVTNAVPGMDAPLDASSASVLGRPEAGHVVGVVRHELEQVLIGVAHVHAHALASSTAPPAAP